MRKRIVSILLALVLCLSLAPMTALAAGSNLAKDSAEYKELEDFLFDFWCEGEKYDFRNVSTEASVETPNILQTLFSNIPIYRGPTPGMDRYKMEEINSGTDPLKKLGKYGYFRADGTQVDWILANVFNCSEEDVSALRSSVDSNGSNAYYYDGYYYAPAAYKGDSFTVLTIKDITPYEDYYFVTYELRDDPEFTGRNDLLGRYFAVVQRKTMDSGTGYWSLYYFKRLKSGETLELPEVSVTVNGKSVGWTDAVPFIDKNSRTLVPLRAVADAMGIDVGWDGNALVASFTNGSKTIYFTKNNKTARTSEGSNIEMDTSAVLKGGRTYAPIRYLAEYFGYQVGWDDASRVVALDPASGADPGAGDESWRNAYAQVLRETKGLKFLLIYVDNDDIPELALWKTSSMRSSQASLYTFYNGKAVYLGDRGAYGELEYSERNNRIFGYTGPNPTPEQAAENTFMIVNGELKTTSDYSGYPNKKVDSWNSYDLNENNINSVLFSN